MLEDDERRDISDDAAAAVEQVTAATHHPGKYGDPGAPLARTPFLIGLAGAVGVIVAGAVAYSVWSVGSMLLIIFVALFLAVGLNPAVVRLRRHGVPRGLAVALVGLVMLLVVCGGVAALIPPIVEQGGQVVQKFPDFLVGLTKNRFLHDLDRKWDLVKKAKEAATAANATQAFGGVLGGVTLVFSTMFNGLMVLVLTFYFLAAFDRLKAGAYRLAPASRRDRIERIGDEILAKVGGYMIGALGIAACAGLTTFVFLLIVGVPYAYALALFVAVLDLIPQVGATLGAVVVCVVGFATSVPAGIACIVFFVLYQQLENWIIYPKVMKRSVSVTDLAGILGVLVGTALLGVVGALIAVPAVAAVQLIMREVVLPRQDRA